MTAAAAAGNPGSPTPGGLERLTPSFRPRQREKLPPCQAGCPISGDVRGWIGIVAQRSKMGLSDEEAYTRAWQVITSLNPFPSVLGRVCPHPCETDCNRTALDTPVSINAMERFLGDWAIANRLSLSRLEPDIKPETIGVIGAGPSGLSFAYQMARRGYRVTVYEQREHAGGMLRYGIPNYRLPEDVLEHEIQRIVDLGVDLQLATTVGRNVTLTQLRDRHAVLYLGIGAQKGRGLGVSGDDEPAVWNGTEYLRRVNSGEPVDVGRRVAVVGGGNTAVDAARTARRAGAEVAILYRRSRDEMPAIDAELEEALAEGVRLQVLVAPSRLERRSDDSLVLVSQGMRLGEPDDSGRRRPVPVPDSVLEFPVDTVIAAVSQEPAWDGLEELHAGGWLSADESGAVTHSLWAGGDVVALGIAGNAIAHGRRAAETLHARLRGLSDPSCDSRPAVGPDDLHLAYYPARPRTHARRLAADEAIRRPDAEVSLGISEQQLLEEASRCLSCGLCLGCEQCWMYCTVPSFARLTGVGPGAYFSLSLDRCTDCGKCVEVCPCSYLELDAGDSA